MSSIFNDFFSNIVSNLNIPLYEDPSVNLVNIDDPPEEIAEKYKNYPRVLEILQQQFEASFSCKMFQRKKMERKFRI